jgi:hypothetical protein
MGTRTPTDTQIKALQIEASEAGDHAQAYICARALIGDADARAECARVIADAQAAEAAGY